MKRMLATTLTLLGLCGLAAGWAIAPAQAQPTSLGRYGAWSVYSLVTPAGRNVCGMVVQGSEGRSLHIQHVRGTNYILFLAFKTSWTIPEGTRTRITMRIDDGAAWTAAEASGQRNRVGWTMRAGLPRFEAEFRNGSRLTLEFPQGSEAPWAVSLRGSGEAMGRLVTCMRASGGPPTQPFGAPPAQPTQPFSSPAPQSPPGKVGPAPPPRAPAVQGQPISV